MRYYSRWHYSRPASTFDPVEKNLYLVKLGEQIREIRKTKGLSQEQLAFKADVDRSYMGGIERGERNVTFLTLIKIAHCLDCNVSEFTKEIPT